MERKSIDWSVLRPQIESWVENTARPSGETVVSVNYGIDAVPGAKLHVQYWAPGIEIGESVRLTICEPEGSYVNSEILTVYEPEDWDNATALVDLWVIYMNLLARRH